jgi:cell division protein FtsL
VSLRHVWLLMALLGSAIAVVMTQHQARKLYIRLHDMQEQTRKLEVERTELQLEQSTLSAHGRVEAAGRERLGMAIPTGPQIQTLPDAVTPAPSAPSGAAR